MVWHITRTPACVSTAQLCGHCNLLNGHIVHWRAGGQPLERPPESWSQPGTALLLCYTSSISAQTHRTLCSYLDSMQRMLLLYFIHCSHYMTKAKSIDTYFDAHRSLCNVAFLSNFSPLLSNNSLLLLFLINIHSIIVCHWALG